MSLVGWGSGIYLDLGCVRYVMIKKFKKIMLFKNRYLDDYLNNDQHELDETNILFYKFSIMCKIVENFKVCRFILIFVGPILS